MKRPELDGTQLLPVHPDSVALLESVVGSNVAALLESVVSAVDSSVATMFESVQENCPLFLLH